MGVVVQIGPRQKDRLGLKGLEFLFVVPGAWLCVGELRDHDTGIKVDCGWVLVLLLLWRVVGNSMLL